MKNLRKVITSLVLIAISFVSYTQTVSITMTDTTDTDIDTTLVSDSLKQELQTFYTDTIVSFKDTSIINIKLDSLTNTTNTTTMYSVWKLDLLPQFVSDGKFWINDNTKFADDNVHKILYQIPIDSVTSFEIDTNAFYCIMIGTMRNNNHHDYYLNLKFQDTTVPPSLVSVNEETIEEVTNTIVYPNPVVNNMTVKFETSNSDMPVEVYNLNGEMIYKNNDYRAIGSNEITINMNDFRKGLYLVKVGNEVKKVIKK